jgi:hypothetical protein
LIKVLDIRDTESSEPDSDYSVSSSSSNSSHSGDEQKCQNISFGCQDTCCNTIKVLTKTEEHEELLLELISKIEDPGLKTQYLKKLKKLLTHPETEASTSKIQEISMSEIFKKFNKSKKPITINDLQLELKNVKTELKQLKEGHHNLEQDVNLLKIELKLKSAANSAANSAASSHNSEADDEEPKQLEDEVVHLQENIILLLDRIHIKKWYSKVTIVINDFKLNVIALIDSGADLSCIQEGLIPTRFYSKSKEVLRSASGSKMHINYELNNAHVCQDNVCFKQSFVLVKNMSDKVILGLPFIALLYPFTTDDEGVTTHPLGESVKFKFLNKIDSTQLKAFQSNSISKTINLITSKQQHVVFLQEEIQAKRIEDQLNQPILQQRIKLFEERIRNEVCSNLPNAFWHRKKHTVNLPYIKGFDERKIPTKARPIQMSSETLEFCQSEIKDLLQKGIIRKSKSPWSCSAFYVQKNAELERGAPRLVINYKPLNKVLEWIRYPIPNKRDLINRLSKSIVFSKFDMKSGFWQIQISEDDKYKTAFVTPFGQYEWNVMPFGLKNAPSEFQNIMNDILNPLSKFSIVYIDDVLIFSKSLEEHWKHLYSFLEVIKSNGLVVSATKIKLFQTNIRFLGFNIQQSKISPISRVIQFADKFPDEILEKPNSKGF